MRAGGGTLCGEYGQRNFIQVDEDDTESTSRLSLSADGQLGERDNRLIVDIPEAAILHVPSVGDLFVDSLELNPQVTRGGEVQDVRITADDLAYDLLQPVSHPDNPQVNEYAGVEVGSGEDVTGDKLAHIRDELLSSELPFQTNEEVAEAVVDRKGSDWADALDESTVKVLIADQNGNEAILAAVREESIDKVLEDLRTTEKPVSETDRALAAWIAENGSGYGEIADRLANGETLSDEEVADILNNYTPSAEEEQAWRDARMAAILDAEDGSGNPIGSERLWTALKTSDDRDEKTALLTALLDIQTADGSTEEPFADLPGLLGELLTDEEKAALHHQALADSELPPEAAYGVSDPEPKALHVEIGVSTGDTNLYHDGDIDVMVTGTSDLKAERIVSERGDVSIEVKDGSLLPSGDEPQNILCANVALKASGNVGLSADALDHQQRDNTPVVAAQLIEETAAGEKSGTIHRDENGKWVQDTAASFDWIRKDLEDATMRLDAVAENGDVALNEIEGGTGLGLVSAEHGDVSLSTDGDVTDVRTDAEKAADKENITSGGDTLVNAPNGAVGAREEPIDVTVGGHMTVNDKDDVHVVSNEDLAITADTQDGVVNGHSDQNLSLDNTAAASHGTGDMVIREATAGGNATVDVAGSISGKTETGSDGSETTEPSVVSAGGSASVTAGGEIRDTEVTAATRRSSTTAI